MTARRGDGNAVEAVYGAVLGIDMRMHYGQRPPLGG